MVIAIVVTLTVLSAGGFFTDADTKELFMLSDNLMSRYSAQFDYTAGKDTVGSAIISRTDKVTLSILSPSPYGGICATYSTESLPDSINITYEGISVDLPSKTFDRINAVMAIFTDDFALALRALPTESIRDYAESELRSVDFNYNGSDISLRYNPDECLPVSLTVSRDGVTVNAVATGFKREDITRE